MRNKGEGWAGGVGGEQEEEEVEEPRSGLGGTRFLPHTSWWTPTPLPPHIPIHPSTPTHLTSRDTRHI
ncbi:hypothetical protein E2C01_064975 [Portunus trituberculatus]|uniref:Uncharacterized protein n=1 Tax=Portunus trituberculatus TaxID=210409 RepID=A0A5B7HD93_PORTR|nr:hypothetical protein [Portunus trituberculatus]